MKYEVTIKQIEIYVMTVEAEDDIAAEAKAEELFDVNKNAYHDNSETETESNEVT